MDPITIAAAVFLVGMMKGPDTAAAVRSGTNPANERQAARYAERVRREGLPKKKELSGISKVIADHAELMAARSGAKKQVKLERINDKVPEAFRKKLDRRDARNEKVRAATQKYGAKAWNILVTAKGKIADDVRKAKAEREAKRDQGPDSDRGQGDAPAEPTPTDPQPQDAQGPAAKVLPFTRPTTKPEDDAQPENPGQDQQGKDTETQPSAAEGDSAAARPQEPRGGSDSRIDPQWSVDPKSCPAKPGEPHVRATRDSSRCRWCGCPLKPPATTDGQDVPEYEPEPVSDDGKDASGQSPEQSTSTSEAGDRDAAATELDRKLFNGEITQAERDARKAELDKATDTTTKGAAPESSGSNSESESESNSSRGVTGMSATHTGEITDLGGGITYTGTVARGLSGYSSQLEANQSEIAELAGDVDGEMTMSENAINDLRNLGYDKQAGRLNSARESMGTAADDLKAAHQALATARESLATASDNYTLVKKALESQIGVGELIGAQRATNGVAKETKFLDGSAG